MYANLTSALTMTTDMPAKDANTLEQSVLALERSALELKRSALALERSALELERSALEREQIAAELGDVRTLLLCLVEQNTVLVDMITQLAGEVLDRPADSVRCQGIAKSTGTQCKRRAVSNGYCHVHQD